MTEQEPTSLAEQVADLENDNEALKALAGQMLATMLLPQNREHLPEALRNLAAHWRQRYRSSFGQPPAEPARPLVVEQPELPQPASYKRADQPLEPIREEHLRFNRTEVLEMATVTNAAEFENGEHLPVPCSTRTVLVLTRGDEVYRLIFSGPVTEEWLYTGHEAREVVQEYAAGNTPLTETVRVLRPTVLPKKEEPGG